MLVVKKITQRTILILLIGIAIFLLIAPYATAQGDSKNAALYIATTNDGLFRLDTENGTIESILDYDFESLRYLEFSHDHQLHSYIRFEDNQSFVEISTIEGRLLFESLLEIPFSFNNVHLTWLPSDQYVVITYTDDIQRETQHDDYTTEYTEYDVVVGRQLLSLRDKELNEWPYRCVHIGDSREMEEFLLQCNYDETLQSPENKQVYAPTALYGFDDGTINYENAEFRALGLVHDIERSNWTWTANNSILLHSGFDQTSERAEGIYQLQHTDPFLVLVVGQPLSERFLLSPDSTQILVEVSFLSWFIFDLESSETRYLDIPLHEGNPGVVWLDNNNIVYATRTGSQTVIHIYELSTGTDKIFPFPYSVFKF